jgi:hypothetical protein
MRGTRQRKRQLRVQPHTHNSLPCRTIRITRRFQEGVARAHRHALLETYTLPFRWRFVSSATSCCVLYDRVSSAANRAAVIYII